MRLRPVHGLVVAFGAHRRRRNAGASGVFKRDVGRLVGLLGAVIALVLVWVAAPALSVRPYVPRAIDFEQAVRAGPPRASAARIARPGGQTTPVLRAPRRFDLIGLRWSGNQRPAVWLRVRRVGGTWSRWVGLGGDTGHGPDGRSLRSGTDPAWAGGADFYQLRLSHPVSGLRAYLVNTTGTATSADRLRTGVRRAAHAAVLALSAPAAAQAGPAGRPPIVPRAAWGASQCRPRSSPSYGRVQVAFVHHTLAVNTYAPHESGAIVLAICRFHRNARGWSDMGYNFLVDRYGRTFEGRAGGIGKAVVGTQAAGYNHSSTGVASIGEFSASGQTPAGFGAVARVLAWKLALHGIPARGTIRVDGRVLNRISAHRDVNRTTCPGNVLYAQLPALRAAVGGTGAGASGLTIGAPSAIPYGTPASFAGRLSDPATGVPLTGLPIELQMRQAGGGFATMASATTRNDGAWNAQGRPLAAAATFRARFPGAPGRPSLESRPLLVGVGPLITLSALPARLPAGGTVTIAGSVVPPKRQLQLVVSRPADFVDPVIARRSVLVRTGRFQVTFRPPRPGRYRFQLLFSGDRVNAAIGSPYATVTALP